MRDRLLRRTLFATVACSAVAAFAGSLVGIATTQGKLRPGGEAASVAAAQRTQPDAERRCPWARPAPGHDDVAL
jgi:hypothetical protein